MTDKRISELPLATSLATTDYFPAVQGGLTKRATFDLLPFTQSGSGATSRTVQDRLRDIVSAFDFMTAAQIADVQAGTALVDVSAAVQAAITSLTNGGIVFFPPGIYKLAAMITVPAGIPIILRGSGGKDYNESAFATKPGTELRSTLRDGASPAIKVDESTHTGGSSRAEFSMEDLMLSGGTYAEIITGGIGQGGATLNNFVGLSMKNRHHWSLRRVVIMGFKFDGLRLDNCYYGAAYNSTFTFNGAYGVRGTVTNVDCFYNCHFQYNNDGTLNLKNTVSCAWEGNWHSGALFNELSAQVVLTKPYFESNNSSSTAGEADINCDTTNFPAAVTLYDPEFFADYSAKLVATYRFTGRTGRLNVHGAMRIITTVPPTYALFNLVGATQMYDYTGNAHNHVNYANFTTGGYCDKSNSALEVTLTGTTLTHYGYNTIRLSAGGALNLDTLDAGSQGQVVTIIFVDANITVRRSVGNIRSSNTFKSSVQSSVTYEWDWVGGVWNEIGRILPGNRIEVVADQTDADATVTARATQWTTIWATTLTATRTATLSTTNAFSGAEFKLIRTSGGNFPLNVVVGSTLLVQLYKNQSADFMYNGTTWVMSHYSDLRKPNTDVVTCYDDFLGDVLADQWNTRVGTDVACVAAVVLANQARGLFRATTGANASADMAGNGTQLDSQLNWQANQGGLVCEFRVLLSAITNVVLFIGLTDQVSALEMPFTLAAGDVLTSNATDAVGVLFDTGADTDNWWLVGVANDVDATKQNSALAPVAATMETWRIEVSATGTATFYRNGTVVGTAMASATRITIPLTPVVAAFARAAASRNVDGDFVMVQAQR